MPSILSELVVEPQVIGGVDGDGNPVSAGMGGLEGDSLKVTSSEAIALLAAMLAEAQEARLEALDAARGVKLKDRESNPFAHVDGKLSPIPYDYFLEIEKGNIPGHRSVSMFGHNQDVDSAAPEDVWINGGVLTRLTSAETMNIVSTSADDDGDPAGAGARTVEITGLDNDYRRISEIVTMNGTTNVLTKHSYLRVSGMVVKTADPTATNTNAGLITATASSAATAQAGIGAAMGLAHKIHYTVPADCDAYLYKVGLNVAKIGGGTASVFFVMTVTPPEEANYNIGSIAMDSDEGEIEIYSMAPRHFPEKFDMKILATTDTNNTELFAQIVLIEVAR